MTIIMRLRRLEIVIAGLTLAFVCFLGGYFTGLKSAVNIIPIAPPAGETRQDQRGGASGSGTAAAAPDTAANEPPATQPPATPAVPTETEAQAPEAVGLPRNTDGRININTASRSELMDLPGIGTVLAERIVDYRTRNGYFSAIDDIRKVSGIGEKRFEAIMDKITVG